MAKRHYIIPVFVPHQGCPHDCVFCNQREITGFQEEMTPKKVERIIEEYISTMDRKNSKIEIAFYGGSFTGLEIKDQTRLLEVAYRYCQKGLVDNLRLSTRPDYIDREILTNLTKYNVQVIELGVQSLVNKVLQASCRGHTAEDVVKSSQLIKEFGFDLGIQLMPGLPESTEDSMIYSVQKAVGLVPDLVRIYPTLIIGGTQLAELYYQGDFKPLTLMEAVEICKQELKLFRTYGIPVIRIGLQPSSGVNKEAVIAGPFHSAFRQLVESSLALERIKTYLGDNVNEDQLTFKVNSKFNSVLRGQKNNNLKVLKEEYGIETKVEIDDSLTNREILISEKKKKI
ncbi:elongator complex protein 3 [Sporohalobacter salinus]|uniref:elongator complex protein 3 n=1 Tax=Sporohalobacter salinus TaxID=1494606 RepID=UPI001960A1E1|nr:radical SAM protein [Sporohalobacter salinus]MBM7623553.1 radical SAM enzyme (TIGR01210 family) [Sporohalobacter salinus]